MNLSGRRHLEDQEVYQLKFCQLRKSSVDQLTVEEQLKKLSVGQLSTVERRLDRWRLEQHQ